ncbi:hypothetical protein F638_1372 [Pseudomonas sp. LAIL14HWK12:I2]|uniref:hypothetical protein n=1 Tax=Pseudomonas sp. LAIL14HWK12:I2 TaxID=1265482 RepID=UPI00106768AC|nr:hypothetical protein [Pseudomonas sp. LAIL14HWK12:I2]TFA85127.1 hypothetical protein F638_1372 [Pseudomonas sp. LAIL14HWK12:I2]
MYINTEALLRALPDIPEILAKLQSGEYVLHGGVVRHAAGSEKGGRIIGHLLFPGDSLQTQESLQKLQSTLTDGLGSLQNGMGQLQQSMSTLQSLQSANLVMSGLNLAVTTAGFVIVCRKLNKISEQIQAQSVAIAKTFDVVKELHERSLLADEAQFRSLLSAAGQFCERGDVEPLKGLIAPFHKEYQFTKLILERHALEAISNIERLSEITLLQDRLVNLGLVMSHVQMRIGAVKYSRDCLAQLGSDLVGLNTQRVEALSREGDVASRITQTHFADLTTFLQQGKKMMPALTYQADVIDLEVRHPGLLQRASESKEILMIAA